MPGTVLRFTLRHMDDNLLQSLSFTPYEIWHEGDPKPQLDDKAENKFRTNGFACNVSDVCTLDENEFSLQISAAMEFMSQHEKTLTRLATSPYVEERSINFGISSRLNAEGTMMQGEWLPVEFLEKVARYKIAVAISIYPIQKFGSH